MFSGRWRDSVLRQDLQPLDPNIICIFFVFLTELHNPSRGALKGRVFVDPFSFPRHQIQTLCRICLAAEFKYKQSLSRIADPTCNLCI